MADKRRVRLRLFSRQEDQELIRTMDGDLYLEEGGLTIRYTEPEASLGRTQTTIRWLPAGQGGELRVIRHREIESEQTFVRGRRLPGRYRTPYGTLRLEAETTVLAARIREGLGSLEWNYVLYTDGEPSGVYALKLEIFEAHADETAAQDRKGERHDA